MFISIFMMAKARKSYVTNICALRGTLPAVYYRVARGQPARAASATQ
jgi:hypothetical protein